MIKHKDHFHGSDLEKIEQIYGIKKEEIVSFSANVNPLGVSPLLRTALSEQIDVITTYPAQMHCRILRHRIRKRHRRKWFHGTDLSFYTDRAPEKSDGHRTYLFRI